MKIEFEKVGEYYLPNLTVKEKKINLSKYGRMKLQYMKKYQKNTFYKFAYKWWFV